MSLFDYERSREIYARGESFYAQVMALMRQADSVNIEKLKTAWPDVWAELKARYMAPGGVLEGERVMVGDEPEVEIIELEGRER